MICENCAHCSFTARRISRKLETDCRALQKTSKEQIAKLTKELTIVQNRDQQYLHEMRRREKETQQLQTRLQQGFNSASSTKENRFGLEVLNPLKPAAPKKWKSRGEEELVQRELASQEVSLRAFSAENADLRASLQALFAELQAALQAHAAPPIDEAATGEVMCAPEVASDGVISLEHSLRASVEACMAESDFSEAQLALPFDMVRQSAESDFRARLVAMQARRLRLQRELDVEQRARDATLALAASAKVADDKQLLLALVQRFEEYREIVAQQESILQSLVVAAAGGTHSSTSAGVGVRNRLPESVESLLAESRRLSLDADMSARERELGARASALAAERNVQQQSSIQMLRLENELEVRCVCVYVCFAL